MLGSNGKRKRFRDIIPHHGIFGNEIMTRKGDVCMGWSLDMPVAFSLSEQAYDDIIKTFSQAIRILPPWTCVHKQDTYRKVYYKPDPAKTGFLEKAFEEHFEGRPYLRHTCHIYLTFSTSETINKDTAGSTLFSAGFSKAQKKPADWIDKCRRSANQFSSILESNVHLKKRVRRMDADELNKEIAFHLSLGNEGNCASDYVLSGDSVLISDRAAAIWAVTESDDLPGVTTSVLGVESMSTDKYHVFLSRMSPAGFALNREHEYNQVIYTVPRDVVVKELDDKRKKMYSFANYSAEDRVNSDELSEFLDLINQESLSVIYGHCNIIVWDDFDKMGDVEGDVVSALAKADLRCTRVLFDAPEIWLASTPGAAPEMSKDCMLTQELTAFLTFGIYESYDPGIPGGKLRLVDRITNVPVDLDIEDRAYNLGLIKNYNGFILGPSGSGKSFTTNVLMKNAYYGGADVFIIDIGDSYEGLTRLVREESGGKDGAYYSYDPDHPFAFNPFKGISKWFNVKAGDDDDSSGKAFLMSIIKTMYTPTGGWNQATEAILDKMITDFAVEWTDGWTEPNFNDFYRYLNNDVRPRLLTRKEQELERRAKNLPATWSPRPYMVDERPVTTENFNIVEMCNAMMDFGPSGKYSFFLNAEQELDILANRFVVFEIDKVKDDDKLFPLWTLCIMHLFEDKMRKHKNHKVLIIEEAWKAISTPSMAQYITWMWRTARKFHAAAMVVTQSVDDIVSSDIIKNVIVNNSEVKVLLDQSKSQNKFEETEEVLALSKKTTPLIMSINRDTNPNYRYKEAFISLGEERSGVWAIEVSPEEALVFESDKTKKRPVMELADKLGSYMEAISETAAKMKKNR